MKLDKEHLYHTTVPIGQGVFIYIAWHPTCIEPVGTVWVFGVNDVAVVMDSYVPRWARRQGVRSFLNTKILEWCPKVITCVGSPEGGRQFLKAQGYRKIPKLGWYLKSKEK